MVEGNFTCVYLNKHWLIICVCHSAVGWQELTQQMWPALKVRLWYQRLTSGILFPSHPMEFKALLDFGCPETTWKRHCKIAFLEAWEVIKCNMKTCCYIGNSDFANDLLTFVSPLSGILILMDS